MTNIQNFDNAFIINHRRKLTKSGFDYYIEGPKSIHIKQKLHYRIVSILILSILLISSTVSAGDIAKGKNTVGIKARSFSASDDMFRDFERDGGSYSAFYERTFIGSISADIEVGGQKRFLEHSATVKQKISQIEAALSVNWNIEIIDAIDAYVGIGVDYADFKNEMDSSTGSDETEESVNGYHGKLGFRLFTYDENFPGFAVILEIVHSQMNSSDEDEIDLSGTSANAGVIFQF